MSDLPAWKKAILDKKKQKDIDEEKKRQVEEAKLSQLPAWKRSLLLRKQDSDTTSGKSSPPLSRSGFASRRKDSLLREKNEDSPVIDDKPTTPVSASKKIPGQVTSPVSPNSSASSAFASPATAPSPAPAAASQERDRAGSASSIGSDDGAGGDDRPNVRQLLGMFKVKQKDDADAGGAPKRPGSAERKSNAGQSSQAKKPSAAPAVGKKQQPSTPTKLSVPPNASAPAGDKPDGAIQSLGSLGWTEGDDEGDDVVTNIDDIVLDALPRVSPKRVAGVESLPTSPSFQSKQKKAGSCLTRHPRALAKSSRSVSFDELNLETVHSFEREASSDEEEEEEQAKEEPDRGPRASGGGLRSVGPAISKASGDQPSGFQAFKPKALSATVTDTTPSSLTPTPEATDVPSWRQQAPASAKKKEPEPIEEPTMAQQSDLVVENIEDQPALLW